jgi:hypothetical protein
MMYWVCFGMFSVTEVITDSIFGFWLPFYYEIKILLVFWLVSPYGNGARIMYKNVVHPELIRREPVIDSYISTAKAFGVSSLWHLWAKTADVVNLAIFNSMQMAQTAIIYQLQRSNNNMQPGLGFNFQGFLPIESPPTSGNGEPLRERPGDRDRDTVKGVRLFEEPMDLSQEVNGNQTLLITELTGSEAKECPEERLRLRTGVVKVTELPATERERERDRDRERVQEVPRYGERGVYSPRYERQEVPREELEQEQELRETQQAQAQARARRRRTFELEPMEANSRRPTRASDPSSRNRFRLVSATDTR